MAACQVLAPQISGAASEILRCLPLNPDGPGVRGAVAAPAHSTGARYGLPPGGRVKSHPGPAAGDWITDPHPAAAHHRHPP